MTHTCLNELWIVGLSNHHGIVASVIYFFQFVQKCKMYCMLNTSLFSFFNVLKKRCRLSLSVVLFINSMANRCISNTLSTFNWQHFLSAEFLLLNDFLYAPFKKSLVGLYNINEKNGNIKVTGRTFLEN